MTDTSNENVFLGGYIDFTNLDAANTAQLRASGHGGVYTHASAINWQDAADVSAVQAVWSAFSAQGSGIFESGFNSFFNAGNVYDRVCKPVGYDPQTITLNLPKSVSTFGTADLTSTETWMNNVRSRPELAHSVIAPFATPGGASSATNPMNGENGHVFSETDSFWGPLAQACLYGGGIALDVPVGNFLSLGSIWPDFLESQIQWGNAHGIKTIVVLSPGSTFTDSAGTVHNYTGSNVGPIVEDVQAVVDKMIAAGAVPTTWAIENSGGGGNVPAGATQAETTPESLNAAALWLANNAPTYQNGSITYPAGSTLNAATTGPDTLTVVVSEDAYKGDAHYVVSVDGQQIGGVQTATALHSTGATNTLTLHGNFSAGTHTVAVSFLDAEYGGSPTADKNLYVKSIAINGNTVTENKEIASNGPMNFQVSKPVAVASNVQTVSGGHSLSTAAGTNNAVVLTTGNQYVACHGATDTITAGSGSDTVYAGSGLVSVQGGTGSMTFVAGATGSAGRAVVDLKSGTNNTVTLGGGTSDIGLAGKTNVLVGSGAATFDLTAGLTSTDVISGFKIGTDHLHIGGLSSSQTQSSYVSSMTATTSGTTLVLGDGTHLTLSNVHATSVSSLFS